MDLITERITKLEILDKELTDEIDAIAINNHLKNDAVWPIADGIYSASTYLNSIFQIMWILKEPYDDFVDGQPYGGGWSMTKDLFNYPLKFAISSKTARMMTYVTYGILNDKFWNDIDYFENDPTIADCIRQIAYINLSKMPAFKTTKTSELEAKFKVWKPTILKQIANYDPQILIFGNTFPLLQNDLFKGEEVSYENYKDYVWAYDYNGKLYLWAYHPGALKKQEMYANTIIEAVKDWKSKHK